MRTVATTRCCSAIALATAACASIMAFAPPAAFFPVRTVWTQPLDPRPAAAPVFLDRVGYFPTTDQHLSAYDLTTGQAVWTIAADVTSKPAGGEGLIFSAGSDGLSALRAADGSRVWHAALETLVVPLVWDNGWLIAATESGLIKTFRATDGHLIWQRDPGARLRAQPALAGDRVYLPLGDGRIVALQIETGTPIWERRLGGPPNDLLALDDRVFVGSQDNSFYALSPRDGRIEWRFATGGDVLGVPVVDQRQVYFVALDNILRALDRRSGAQQWLRALPIRPTRGPVQVAETMLVSGSSATVFGYAVKDGHPAGDVSVTGAVFALPHVVTDPQLVILVGDDVVKGAAVTAIGTKPAEPAAAAPPAARLLRMPDVMRSDASLTKKWPG